MCDASFPLDENSPLRSSAGESIFQGLRTGAFAEEVVVGATQVCAIPDVIPVECASLLACGVLTGVGAVINTAKVSPGSNVVVIGAGGVGLNAIQGAALADANTVIAIDIAADKLEAARSFGATHAINSVSEDATSTVLQETGGRGADYVFVTVGAKTAIDQSVQMLGRGGTAVIVGMPESGVMAEYDPSELASRSQKIIGSKMGSARISADIPRLVKLYQEGHLKLDELVSGRYPLEDINDAIASVKDGMALRNVVIF
jgi:Zn-dependent alcohol dehydrogenase